MISRRDLLAGAAAFTGAAIFPGRASRTLAKASQPSTPVSFTMPSGACDCHTHVFGDPTRFRFAAGRTYTPEAASVDEMRSLHRALHVDRVVIVQPSVYAADNACTLDAVRQLGDGARAVAVIDDRSDLDALRRAGVRGVRLNLATAGQTDPQAARALFDHAVDRIRPLGWHVQLYTELSIVEALKDRVLASPIPVVFDHFGGAQARLGTGQPGFRTLLDLVHSGHAYVKVSAAYRSSTSAPDYADVAPLASALIAANAERILWGSDWPHPDSSRAPGRLATDVAPLQPIDDGRVLNQLPVWAPSAATRTAILVDNPGRLYFR